MPKGVYIRINKHAHNFIDLTGQKFGRLIVIEEAGRNKESILWKCVCNCGNDKIISGASLSYGHTKSCGCLSSEISIQKAKAMPHNYWEGKKRPEMSGILHHNWNSNITDEERIIGRLYPEYYVWRKAVYERDNYTCQKCDSNKSGTLNAHHLESYDSNKELRITLSNGVTLCKECHKDFHHQYGYGDNTKEQFEEFIR